MSYFAKDSINWACAKAEFVLSYLELWKIFPILTHWTDSNHTPATSGVHPLSKRLASTSSLMQGKSYWKHIWPQLSHQFTFTCSTCKLTSGMNTTMSWSRWSSQQQMVFDTAGPERLYLNWAFFSSEFLYPPATSFSEWSHCHYGFVVPSRPNILSTCGSLPSSNTQVILLPLRHVSAWSRVLMQPQYGTSV